MHRRPRAVSARRRRGPRGRALAGRGRAAPAECRRCRCDPREPEWPSAVAVSRPKMACSRQPARAGCSPERSGALARPAGATASRASAPLPRQASRSRSRSRRPRRQLRIASSASPSPPRVSSRPSSDRSVGRLVESALFGEPLPGSLFGEPLPAQAASRDCVRRLLRALRSLEAAEEPAALSTVLGAVGSVLDLSLPWRERWLAPPRSGGAPFVPWHGAGQRGRLSRSAQGGRARRR